MSKWIIEADEKPTKEAKEVIPYEEQELEKLIYKLKKITSIALLRAELGTFDEESIKNNIEVFENDVSFSITVWKD